MANTKVGYINQQNTGKSNDTEQRTGQDGGKKYWKLYLLKRAYR